MQLKIAIFIYEPLTGDVSRAYRALRTAWEFASAGDEVKITFDGSGVETLAEISKSGNSLHKYFLAVRENIAGACKLCSQSHKVADVISEAGFELLDEVDGEASVRKYVTAGYTVLNY